MGRNRGPSAAGDHVTLPATGTILTLQLQPASTHTHTHRRTPLPTRMPLAPLGPPPSGTSAATAAPRAVCHGSPSRAAPSPSAPSARSAAVAGRALTAGGGKPAARPPPAPAPAPQRPRQPGGVDRQGARVGEASAGGRAGPPGLSAARAGSGRRRRGPLSTCSSARRWIKLLSRRPGVGLRFGAA